MVLSYFPIYLSPKRVTWLMIVNKTWVNGTRFTSKQSSLRPTVQLPSPCFPAVVKGTQFQIVFPSSDWNEQITLWTLTCYVVWVRNKTTCVIFRHWNWGKWHCILLLCHPTSPDQCRIQVKSTLGIEKKKRQTKPKAYSEALQRKRCPTCPDVTINEKQRLLRPQREDMALGKWLPLPALLFPNQQNRHNDGYFSGMLGRSVNTIECKWFILGCYKHQESSS